MNVTITIFHNVAGVVPNSDDLGQVGRRFFFGYAESDPVTPVYRLVIPMDLSKSYLDYCEVAWYIGNAEEDDERIHDYRARKLRSVSVGDVVSIDCEHKTAWFSCARSGWDRLRDAPAISYGIHTHGTHSDDDIRAVSHG